ncbi:MAG: hypothetical protein ACRCSK_07295 [Fusobacteriaceae bacterium]
MSEDNLEQLKKINAKIKKYEQEYKILKSKEISEMNRQERKKRASTLISFGSIFETANLLGEDYDCLLGYLSRYKRLSENVKSYLGMIGLEIRKQKKEANEKISEQEIIFLMDESRKKEIDIFVLYYQIFNRRKKTFASITRKEFEILKRKLCFYVIILFFKFYIFYTIGQFINNSNPS